MVEVALWFLRFLFAMTVLLSGAGGGGGYAQLSSDWKVGIGMLRGSVKPSAAVSASATVSYVVRNSEMFLARMNSTMRSGFDTTAQG